VLRATQAHPTSRDEIATYIRARIASGEYRAFTRIPQDEVAAAVGFTRIPVREALFKLEAEGLVRIEANRGAFVNPFGPDEIRCHFELAGYAGGMLARRAAQARSAELAEILTRLWPRLSKAADADEFERLTLEFASYLEAFGGSSVLHAASQRFHAVIPGNFYAAVPDAISTARPWFEEQFRAQIDHNAALAQNSAMSMAAALAECLIRALAARGVLLDLDGVEEEY
jgi:DNA-binding GntR family transcriptional regulator